ncbi:AAA family ATPase [Pelagibaculum spongiae]|uniref:ATP-binding protein n=1 Tax=Pelagibaculum spongiae TaxID=2080658 RepID=A0A2V1GVZ4_9GAMM|nr:AAA family ATPase [Pelagibaculum spongiae]PVZ64893.1 ATP-binding protein [Pelagibaculum spongiae]
MEIKYFKICDIGMYESQTIKVAPTDDYPDSNATVVIGNNGSGKTTLLQAVATSLSWLVARISSEKGVGKLIEEDSIRNSANDALIGVCVRERLLKDFQERDWELARKRKGKNGRFQSDLQELALLANFFRQRLTDDPSASLPLVAFYPAERGVLDIPLKIRKKRLLQQIDGFENSLGQSVDFRRFFEWFREREDVENERGVSDETITLLKKELKSDEQALQRLEQLIESKKDRQLTAVRSAISSFMPDLKNLRVRRKPRLHMSVDKNGETFDVSQLSQGEKSLMALVGDIARRLAMMNPALENPLHGDGVVLIDEVDLHLHPQWQRSLIQRLTSTFPNIQFVLTTHSPIVISDNRNILTYLLNDGEVSQLPSQFGKDVNSVLLDVMNTNIRNSEVEQKIDALFDSIQEVRIVDACGQLEELEQQLSADNIELMRARLLLRKLELKREKNH